MKNSSVRRLSSFHTVLYRMTGGRAGHRLAANDMLLLTTTGRISGRPHRVPLLYLKEADQLLVIASFGGRPSHPDWYLNLQADPVVNVQILGQRRRYMARTADSSERARRWDRVMAAYPAYREYQLRTDREIPLVFLTPRQVATSG